MSNGCLLVVAHHEDPAVQLLKRQLPHRVAHAAVDDLSRAGWRYENDRPERAMACAGGHIVPATDIAAVVCRIHAVAPTDVPHIDREDREYVASEINGFLYAWLTQFTGVLFNAPTWTSLAGPAWHPLQWTQLVSRLGIPVSTSPESHGSPDTVTATVVGDAVFGVTEPALVAMSLRVARASQAGLVSVTFTHDGTWRFCSADPCPALDASTGAALLLRAFPGAEADIGALCGAA